MRRSHAIAAAAALFAVCLTCAPAVSGADERSGVLRGKFVRLAEKAVGEREYVAIVVQPAGKDAHVTVLFPRSKADILRRARGLKAGQMVEIPFVREGGQMWVRQVAAQRRTDRPKERERRDREHAERREREHAERRDRDRAEARHHRERRDRDKAEGERRERERHRVERRDPASAEIRELAAIVRRLAHGLERIQREMHELRAENARLRRLLRAHRELRERRDRPKTDRPKTDRPESDRPKPDRPDAPREE
ncbi:MAG: hypothetical protein ACYS5V_07525 [Planctomycetota bacterium]|jgi:hypothetical protein